MLLSAADSHARALFQVARLTHNYTDEVQAVSCHYRNTRDQYVSRLPPPVFLDLHAPGPPANGRAVLFLCPLALFRRFGVIRRCLSTNTPQQAARRRREVWFLRPHVGFVIAHAGAV